MRILQAVQHHQQRLFSLRNAFQQLFQLPGLVIVDTGGNALMVSVQQLIHLLSAQNLYRDSSFFDFTFQCCITDSLLYQNLMNGLPVLQKLLYNILSIYILRHWYSPIF